MASKWRNDETDVHWKLPKINLFIHFNLKESYSEFAEKIKCDAHFLKSAKIQNKL